MLTTSLCRRPRRKISSSSLASVESTADGSLRREMVQRKKELQTPKAHRQLGDYADTVFDDSRNDGSAHIKQNEATLSSKISRTKRLLEVKSYLLNLVYFLTMRSELLVPTSNARNYVGGKICLFCSPCFYPSPGHIIINYFYTQKT